MPGFDQRLDLNGQDIHRIVTLYGCPQFVKQASQVDVCGDADLPPHQFADPTRKLYPCHTAAATWLSTAFFHEKKAEFTPTQAARIDERLRQAATYFQIGQVTHDLMEKVAASITVDANKLPDSAFAIVFDNADGARERHYPMRNALEVKTAADWLLKNRDELPYDDRRLISDRILEKAASFGADISTHRYALEKMSGVGICAAADAAKLVRRRVACIPHTKLPALEREEMLKVAEIVERDPERMYHHSPLVKLAGIIDTFDRKHGLHRHYGADLERPEDVLFAVTTKVAADMTNDLVGSPLTGNYYKRAELSRVRLQDLGDALGHDFVDAVSAANAFVDTEKLANIVPTLPLSDAKLFDVVVTSAGLAPFATKSAAATTISPQDQMALAQAHTPAPGSLWGAING